MQKLYCTLTPATSPRGTFQNLRFPDASIRPSKPLILEGRARCSIALNSYFCENLLREGWGSVDWALISNDLQY
jgi:hypothetical protein